MLDITKKVFADNHAVEGGIKTGKHVDVNQVSIDCLH